MLGGIFAQQLIVDSQPDGQVCMVMTERRVPTKRKLRVLQICCVIYALLLLVLLLRFPSHPSQGALTLAQWIAVLGAIFCAVDGFYMQRKFLRGKKRKTEDSCKSTPLQRWFLGNLMRFVFATAVCLWAYLLRNFRGPNRLVYTLYGVGIVLLLIWQPGNPPAEQQQ